MYPGSILSKISTQFIALPLEDSLSSDECIATTTIPAVSNRAIHAALSGWCAFRHAPPDLSPESSLSSNETLGTIYVTHPPSTQALLVNRRADAVALPTANSRAAIERNLISASELGLQAYFEFLLFDRSTDEVNLSLTSAPLIASTIDWHIRIARLNSPNVPVAMGTSLIERMLTLGARVNQPDGTEQRQSALWMALQQTNEKIVCLLLEHGCDPNSSQALTEASQRGMHNHVRVLLGYGANPNALQGGKLPLNQACLQGDIEMAALLLKSGARIDSPDREGKTALMYARISGNIALVDLLCSRGAAPSDANLGFVQQDPVTQDLPNSKNTVEKNT